MFTMIYCQLFDYSRFFGPDMGKKHHPTSIITYFTISSVRFIAPQSFLYKIIANHTDITLII